MGLSWKVRPLSAVLVPMPAPAACSGGRDGAGDGGGDEPVKITIWSWDSTVAQVVPDFEAANPKTPRNEVRSR
ncbi:hypothetical protein ACQP1K_01045 [Sphaerimonospora sp. CA-214678]|uniref:hypothetical protein n=1 Tax=Sphaerimonospora sp. CA-214678 TaxID=3240029 RepID=UPI003D92D35C